MIAVALKGLLGRKTRAILTALAIVLGTGMVSATFIFTDTLNHAFNGVFSAPYEQASVVVSGKQIVTGAANTPSLPVVGVPARRLGGSMGRLASANSGRNPARTAATA